VFELRPEDDGWSMFWRPLPRHESEPDGHLFNTDPRNDPRAIRIASGLLKAQWLAFRKREREPDLEAKLVHDLPAHMELNVVMTSGYAAQWMFEVAWLNGPETAEEMAAEEEAALAEAAAGGAGGRGGQGRRGGGAGGAGGGPGPGGVGGVPGAVTHGGGGVNDADGRGTIRRNVAVPMTPRGNGDPRR
jgi:hypothetical protein